jgi:type I restriction enzyme, S subunit
MPEWQSVRLREICGSIDYGLTASAVSEPVGPRFLRITDIVSDNFEWANVPFVNATPEQRKKYRLYAGDIVIARTGATTGHSKWISDPPIAVFASYLIRLRIKREYDSRFVGYLLKSDQFTKYVGGVLGDKSAQPNASAATLTNAPLRLPSVRKAQEAISETLGALDDKIAVNQATSRTSYELAQAIFSAQNLAHESALSSIIDLRYGKALPEGVREPGNVPVFGSNGRSGWHSEPLTPGPGIIIGRKGANAGSVSWSSVPFWAIDTAFFVRPISKDIPMEYLYLLLETVDFRRQVGDSAIPGLNREIALACTVGLPPNDVISQVASEVRPLLELSSHMSEESSALVSLRDTLLPQLMSGEIRIRDAERIVEDAT